jgi:hypothetical protein
MEKLHNELNSLYSSPNTVLLGDEVKDEMNRSWEIQYIPDFGCKT